MTRPRAAGAAHARGRPKRTPPSPFAECFSRKSDPDGFASWVQHNDGGPRNATSMPSWHFPNRLAACCTRRTSFQTQPLHVLQMSNSAPRRTQTRGSSSRVQAGNWQLDCLAVGNRRAWRQKCRQISSLLSCPHVCTTGLRELASAQDCLNSAGAVDPTPTRWAESSNSEQFNKFTSQIVETATKATEYYCLKLQMPSVVLCVPSAQPANKWHAVRVLERNLSFTHFTFS